MTTDLGRRLHDLAIEAPPSLPAEGLWERGVRRHRSRRAAAVGATFAVVAAVIGGFALQAADDVRGDGAPPVVSTVEVGHLPRTIHEPSPWSEGTKDAGELGALSVLGSADRKRPKGLAGMVAYSSMYGISAADGTARFLDLPTSPDPDMPGLVSWVATLSPDGRKVAFPRYDQSGSEAGGLEMLIGWRIYDTVTGGIVEIQEPVGQVMNEGLPPVFSADSRYLLTASHEEGNETSGESFVAWNVATGARFLVEEQARDSIPNVGSGPDGIVWSRGDTTYTYDPDTGDTSSIQAEHRWVIPSFAPSGTGFATVTETGQIYVGPSPDRMTHIRDVNDVNTILGWRDPGHVVVALTDRDYAVVDVSDGSMKRGSFGGSVNLNMPMLAADLWTNDLVDGVSPPQVFDPRTRGRLTVLAGVLLAGTTLAIYVRRRRNG